MRSDNLKKHMKIHDKNVEVEPLSSVTSSDVIPLTGSNDVSYKLTNMNEEALLKKMLQCEREYKEKMEMGRKMYEYVKEYDIDEKK